MTRLAPELTIMIPVYNEEESLVILYQVLLEYLRFTPMPSVVLFIDDGSTDGSLTIIQGICKQQNHFGYVSLAKNGGLSSALKAGIDVCTTTYIGYMDADLQTSPKEFMSFFQYLPDFHMVTGIRDQRHDNIIKKLSSKIANQFRRWIIHDGIQDTCCPLKIMRTNMARQLPFFKGMHRFLPALIQQEGGKVKQIKVTHYQRIAGKSKYHLFNRLWGPFLDTLALAWMKNRLIRYEIKQSELHCDQQLEEVLIT